MKKNPVPVPIVIKVRLHYEENKDMNFSERSLSELF